MSALRLQSLGEETWGNRLTRARQNSHLSLKEVAARITALGLDVSYSTLGRLEREPEVPRSWRHRAYAFLAFVAYGYEPTEEGLSENDLPRWITDKQLRDLRKPGNSCCPFVAA